LDPSTSDPTTIGDEGEGEEEGDEEEDNVDDDEVDREQEQKQQDDEEEQDSEIESSVSVKKGKSRTTLPSSRASVSVGTTFKALFKSIWSLLQPWFSPVSSARSGKHKLHSKSKSKRPTTSSSSTSSKKAKNSTKGTDTATDTDTDTSAGAGAGAVSSTTLNHLEQSFHNSDANARVHKELRAFVTNPPDGCRVAVHGGNIRQWMVTLTGAAGTIYQGEQFKLKLIFPKQYPSKPPSVYFVKPSIPKHQHVYSNGDICLNLLGRDWRPTMTAQALVVSILSRLSSAKEKKLPQDNAMHADNAPGQQQEGWLYHDDKC